MSRWDDLYRYMRGVEAERLEAERRQREAESACAELDAWASRALGDVWARVRAALEARAREFVTATGRRVDIAAHPAAQTSEGALPALHVIELRLDSSVVYVYSHQFSGALPNVHVGYWPRSEGGRHHRMLSMPVATLERRSDEGWSLRRALPTRSREEVSVDDLVYRAFELLVRGVVRVDPRADAPRSQDASVLSSRTLPHGTP